MKKIITALLFLLFTLLPVSAEKVMPEKVDHKNTRTIGVYQVSNNIELYQNADENSEIIAKIKWNKNEITPENFTFRNTFIVFIPNKSLALMQVTEETEEWVEVIQKAGYLTVESMKDANPGKLMQEICGLNKKYKLELKNPSNDDIAAWIENANK